MPESLAKRLAAQISGATAAGLCVWLLFVGFANAPAPMQRPQPLAMPATVLPWHGRSPGAPEPAAPAQGQDPAVPSAVARSPLIVDFEASSNLRSFVHEALRQPDRGGVFYALRALAECRRWQVAQSEPEPDVVQQRSHAELARRLAWVDLANRRCASFGAEDLADAEVQALLARGAAQGDPLVRAYHDWLAALQQGAIEALLPAMQRVLASADPGLLEWVALTGVDYLQGRAGTAAPLDDLARRRRLDAWALLPCELGADCTRPDLGSASPCIGAGLCTHGRRQAVLFDGMWRSEAERAALAAELAALKRAVLARDARAALGL